MTSADLFWARVQRRVSVLTPSVALAFHKAIEVLKARFSLPEVQRLIADGSIEQAIGIALAPVALAVAFAGYRARLQQATREAITYFAKDIPKVPSTITIAFDVLNPRVVDAVRRLDTEVMKALTADLRDVVRATILKGIEDGAGPRVTAKALRDVLGLAPNQLEHVQNFRKALESGGSVAGYTLRDKRLRTTDLTPEQIDRQVEVYTRRRVAQNAETVSRTATLDSYKLGQKLSWQDAIDKGIVDEGSLVKQWKGVMDDRERDEHIAMEGETVPFDSLYSNGEDIPGESTWNCRCLSVVYVRRAA